MEPDADLKYRIDQAFFNIIEVRPDMREDLRRMWRHVRDLWNQLDQELVNCRRLNKTTALYSELEIGLRESLENLEGYITWGHLRG